MCFQVPNLHGHSFSLTFMKQKASGAFHIKVTVETSEDLRVDRANGYFRVGT